MSAVEPAKAIRIISEHAWTVLVISAQGEIVECVPFDHIPPAIWAYENRTRFSGCAVREIPKKKLSLAELETITKDAAKYIEMLRRYERD